MRCPGAHGTERRNPAGASSGAGHAHVGELLWRLQTRVWSDPQYYRRLRIEIMNERMPWRAAGGGSNRGTRRYVYRFDGSRLHRTEKSAWPVECHAFECSRASMRGYTGVRRHALRDNMACRTIPNPNRNEADHAFPFLGYLLLAVLAAGLLMTAPPCAGARCANCRPISSGSTTGAFTARQPKR